MADIDDTNNNKYNVEAAEILANEASVIQKNFYGFNNMITFFLLWPFNFFYSTY